MKAILNAQRNVEMILGKEKQERDEQDRDSRKHP